MRAVLLLLCVVAVLGAPKLHRKNGKLEKILQNEQLRKKLCKEKGFACEKVNTKKIVDIYVANHGKPKVEDLEPIILFPGLAGSGFEAEIDKNYKPAWNCFKEWTWWGIWINLYEALAQTCWFDNLYVNYNATTNTYHDNPGVKIKPRDFGGLNGVNKLDHFDDPLGLTDYYQPVIESLEGIGYKGGETLFGAPYDWRISVDYLMDHDVLENGLTYEQSLKSLVELAYNRTNGKKCHLITHSMGGPTALYFLNRQSSEWKDKHIASFIPIAGPWAGVVKSLKAMVSGDNMGAQIPLLDISLLKEKDIAHVMRSSGGTAYLSPDYDYYGDTVFVSNTATGKNYTANDFVQMWDDLGVPSAGRLFSETRHLISEMTHPEVESYCLYGYGVNTEIHLTYDQPFPSNPSDVIKPKVDYSDLGDGTVPLFSLIECKNWMAEEGNSTSKVNCQEYNLVGHSAILKDEEVHMDLLEIVTHKTKIKGCDDTVQYKKAVAEMSARGYKQKK